jgi:hypothetical protein
MGFFPLDALREFAADSSHASTNAPNRAAWRLLDDDWLTRMNQNGWRIKGRPPELCTRHNMQTI